MDTQEQTRWARVLVVIAILLVAGGIVWQRLAEEGRLPAPSERVVFLLLLTVVVALLGMAALRALLRRQTEDAAVLHERIVRGRPFADDWHDYSRDYPLVFRPEWRSMAINMSMPLLTVLFAVVQSERLSPPAKVITAVALTAGVAGVLGLYVARGLTISWQGVTLKDFRRERFWAWDEVVAVVSWERRGRRQPALRLNTMRGERKLVPLGGIDFAREELLFDALIARVGRVEVQVDDTVTVIEIRRGDDLPRILRETGLVKRSLFDLAEAGAEAEAGESTDEPSPPPGTRPGGTGAPPPAAEADLWLPTHR